MTTATTERPIVRPDLLAVLEDGGYRITEPRRNVIAALDRKDEGFTAEELCNELPSVGRATVYRTIKLLQRAGVICKLAMPDGAPRYSLARVDHHHHTVCVRCGTVGEFKHATIERLLRAVSQEVAGEIVGHRLEVFISCTDCNDPVRWQVDAQFGHPGH